jgi:hypothetical protein
MTTPTWIKSFDELLATLRANNVPHQANPANQTIEIRTAADAFGNILYVRWEKQFPFVQIIQPMIQNVPPARVQAVEAAIARINNAAVFAGLGFDYPSHLVYFRITMNILPEGVRWDLLTHLMQGAVINASEVADAMRRVVAGAAGEDVLSLTGKAPGN